MTNITHYKLSPFVINSALFLISGLLFIAALQTGAANIHIMQAITDKYHAINSLDSLIFFEIRLPRAILAATVGATLGMAGAALQGLLRNPRRAGACRRV